MSSLFAYSTPKVVVIKDKLLGIQRFFFILPVMVYVIYALFVEGKYYMIVQRPQTVLLTSVDRPSTYSVLPSSLSYCLDTASNTPTFTRIRCSSGDGVDVTDGNARTNELFITTHIRTSTWNYNNNCVASNTVCTTPWIEDTTSGDQLQRAGYFMTGIENFEISLHHETQATEYMKYSNEPQEKFICVSSNRHGKLYDMSNNVLTTFPKNGRPDVMSLNTLLKAGGITLDSACTASEGTCVPSEGTTIRKTGITMIVYMEYSNVDNLEDGVDYVYRVRVLQDKLYNIKTQDRTLALRPIIGDQKIITTRSGVKIIFVPVGKIGKFDFPTLFVYLASCLALLMLSTVLIEFMMLCVVPRRKLYAKMKYEDNVDFEEVVRKLNVIKKNDKGVQLQPSEQEDLAFKIVRDEASLHMPLLVRDLLQDSDVNDKKAEFARCRLIFGGKGNLVNVSVTDSELGHLFNVYCEGTTQCVQKDTLKDVFQSIDIPYDKMKKKVEHIITTIMEQKRTLSNMDEEHDEDAGLDANNKNSGSDKIERKDFITLMKCFDIAFPQRVGILLLQQSKNSSEAYRSTREILYEKFNEMDTQEKGAISTDIIFKYLTKTEDIRISASDYKALISSIDIERRGVLDAQDFALVKMFLSQVTGSMNYINGDDMEKAIYGTEGGHGSSGMVEYNPNAPTVETGNNVVPRNALTGSGGSVITQENKLNATNWQSVRSQFRAITAFVNGLRDELRELTLITRMLQRRVLPASLETVVDHEPIHLSGDWNGEQSNECKTS